jgi:hypothetical protein
MIRRGEDTGSWYLFENDKVYLIIGYSLYASLPTGRTMSCVTSGRPVPDDEVPDEVWATLAKWRLTGEKTLAD